MSVTVTITGADDGVDTNDLRELSDKFPFAEWGILYSTKRQGEKRYPSEKWLRELGASTDGMRIALHVCGEAARSTLSGSFGLLNAIYHSLRFDRVQVNGYAFPSSMSFLHAARRWGVSDTEWILQARSLEDADKAAMDARIIGRASILIDPSGGRGRDFGALTGYAPPTGVRVGLAGGITPENVSSALTRAMTRNLGWIDMESGVRSDDRFDLEKVRSVLTQVAAFREAA